MIPEKGPSEPIDPEADVHHLDKNVIVAKTTEDHKAGLFAVSKKIWEGEDYIPTVWDRWMSEDGFYTILLGEKVVRGGNGGDLVVGCMKYTRLPRNEILLEGLRMDPEYEGKGFASIAVTFFMGLVDSLEPRVLRFATSDENVFSHHFGDKYGFQKVASFFHRFMLDDEIGKKVEEIRDQMAEDLNSMAQGATLGVDEYDDGVIKDIVGDGERGVEKENDEPGRIVRTSHKDFGRAMIFLQNSPEWKPAHNLLSHGWVFHPYTDGGLLSLLGSELSFFRVGEGGEILGIILADHSNQYPTDIDITWLSGDRVSALALLTRVFQEADLDTVHEIAAKISTESMTEIVEEFGLHRHPRVDGTHVFEKNYS